MDAHDKIRADYDELLRRERDGDMVARGIALGVAWSLTSVAALLTVLDLFAHMRGWHAVDTVPHLILTAAAWFAWSVREGM